MDLNSAKKEVDLFFQTYGLKANPKALRRERGKVYELYCLAKTVQFLKKFPPISISFMGDSVDFKASPGKVDRTKSFFIISKNGQDLELHVDIEVRTLSSTLPVGAADRSAYHEIDLVLVKDAQDGYRPAHDQIVLGIECKSHGSFHKWFLRQVLGVRRELSLLTPKRPSELGLFLGEYRAVRAYPASECWLAFTDPMGMRYRHGPKAFGIKFKHRSPP